MNWFENPYLKAYLHAAMNPTSKGWFGVAVYSQDVDGVGTWRVVSQLNLDFVMLMIAWVSASVVSPSFTDSNSILVNC